MYSCGPLYQYQPTSTQLFRSASNASSSVKTSTGRAHSHQITTAPNFPWAKVPAVSKSAFPTELEPGVPREDCLTQSPTLSTAGTVMAPAGRQYSVQDNCGTHLLDLLSHFHCSVSGTGASLVPTSTQAHVCLELCFPGPFFSSSPHCPSLLVN